MTNDAPFSHFLMWLLVSAVLAVAWVCWAMRTRTCYLHSHAMVQTSIGLFKVPVSDREPREKIIKRITTEGATGQPFRGGSGANYEWFAPGVVQSIRFVSE